MADANLRKGTELAVNELRETVKAAEAQRTLITHEFWAPLMLLNVELTIVSLIGLLFLSSLIKLKDLSI
jgi:hypothetical protein